MSAEIINLYPSTGAISHGGEGFNDLFRASLSDDEVVQVMFLFLREAYKDLNELEHLNVLRLPTGITQID